MFGVFTRIVAAVDLDGDRSEAVLDTARELAAAMGAKVLVAHVQELERSATLAGAGRPGLAIPAQPPADVEERARHRIDAAVEELRRAGVDAEGRVQSSDGSTAKELIEIAAAFGAELIVIGDRGSRMTDLLLGSVAHKVVHAAPCPVLLVR